MATSKSVPIPGGIADERAGTVFVEGSNGRILLLELGTGRLLARSDFEATPLSADGTTVVAWRRTEDSPTVRLSCAGLEGDKLVPRWETPLALPDWVDPDPDDPDSLTLQAARERDSVVVSWTARARYRGGAPPPPEIEAAATHDGGGTIRLDLAKGTVESDERVEAAPRVEEDATPPIPGCRPVPYRSGKAWLTRPLRSGPKEAHLVRRNGEQGIALLTGTGAASAETRLSGDANARADVTPDGRTIFIQESTGDAPTERRASS